MNKDQIIQYYDTCESDYRIFWDLNHSYAMHAGYWDDRTRTLRDALRRENEILAEIARVKEGERILDAGCGVGGSSIFLAQRYRCEVVGITLSEKQVDTARQKAKLVGVDLLANFQVMDYTCTSFADGSFDIVWGIESICHAEDKSLFIKEAARLLRKGGRLVIADAFALLPVYSLKEARAMNQWLKGWGVQSLDTAQNFDNQLQKYGFKDILFKDITPHVLPSSKRLYLYSWPALVISKLAELIGWRSQMQTDNLRSARFQYQTLKRHLWQYGIFCAEKS